MYIFHKDLQMIIGFYKYLQKIMIKITIISLTDSSSLPPASSTCNTWEILQRVPPFYFLAMQDLNARLISIEKYIAYFLYILYISSLKMKTLLLHGLTGGTFWK